MIARLQNVKQAKGEDQMFKKAVATLLIMLITTVNMINVNVSASTILMSGTTTNLPNWLGNEAIGLGALIGESSESVPGMVLPTPIPPGGGGNAGGRPDPPGFMPPIDFPTPPIAMPETGFPALPVLGPDLEETEDYYYYYYYYYCYDYPEWRPPPWTTPPTSPPSNNTEEDTEDDEGDAPEDNEDPNTVDIEALEDDPFGPRALDTISDTSTAVHAVHNAFIKMSPEYLDAGVLELFAEQAIGRAASGDVSGNLVVVSQATIAPFENIAINTRDAIYGMLHQEGYEPWRELRANVSFVTNYREMEVRLEPSSYQAAVQYAKIRTPYYEVTFPSNFIASEVANAPLTVNIMAGNIHTVQFSRVVSSPLILSVPPISNIAPAYQTLTSIEGATALTKFNPTSSLLEARIGSSGTLSTGANRVNFGDIQGLSPEMQMAIRALASQGVVFGNGSNRFGPEDLISRAEIASITVRMLDQLDPFAVSRFDDVRQSDWFYAAVGSAYNRRIMQGNGRFFYPSSIITRNQLTSVSARILRNEGFSIPSNPNHYLSRFTDRNDFARWSLGDISLAAKENIVIPREDGRFRPNALVNRGYAAQMLYRTYLRIFGFKPQ